MWPSDSTSWAVLWTARLAALAVLVDGFELLSIRRAYQDQGIWTFQLVAEELRVFSRPVRWLLGACFGARSFQALTGLRLLLALLILSTGRLEVAPLLLLGAVLTAARFRGSYNGGSDSMAVVLWIGLSLIAWVPARFGGPALGLGLIAVQSGLSYFIAGLVKVRRAPWRSGLELRRLSGLPAYEVSAWARRALARPGVAPVLAFLILLLECGFPLAFLGPGPCLGFLAAMFTFHGLNALVFGLNRFWWVWTATYPAVYWASQLGPGRDWFS